MLNIGVIFGGESCEHDISVITGVQLMSKLNEYLYNIVPIYIGKDGTWVTGNELKDLDNYKHKFKKTKNVTIGTNDGFLYLLKGKKCHKLINLDMCFVCLHGINGEDGCVAGLLELNKIPYSSCGVLASSCCMDKVVFKNIIRSMNIDTIDCVVVSEDEVILDAGGVMNKISNLGYPVIIKPSKQGSSIGIEVCNNESDIIEKLKKSLKFDKKLLIEKFIKIKKEVNIALLSNKDEVIVSHCEEPISRDVILSFDEKYLKNSGGFETIRRIIPAKISDEQKCKIEKIAREVYVGLDMFGIVRFDFIIDEEDKIYLNEANTIPGSMANYLFDKEKYNYPKLIDIIISNAFFRNNNRVKQINNFNSDVLKVGVSGLKK